MTEERRDWIKHPWSFVSSRYGPKAEAAMIEAHEMSGEFLLERPAESVDQPLACPSCGSTHVRVDESSGAFPERAHCTECGRNWYL